MTFESDNEGCERYVIDDPDLIESESEFDLRTDSSKNTRSLEGPSKMIEYRVNWLGWIFGLGAVGYYGWILFEQLKIQLPSMYDDTLPVSMAFKLRYIGVFGYFLMCLLRPSYIFECRNAEAPLLASTVMELYYLLSYGERSEPPPFLFELMLPVALSFACFMRRKPYWRVIMNPWTKDKSELLRVIQVFRTNKLSDL